METRRQEAEPRSHVSQGIRREARPAKNERKSPMQPDRYLQFAGTFLTYCAQVTAGLVLCLVLCRLSLAPARRFRMWLSFLLLSGTWGLILVIRSVEARAGVPAHSSSLF